ncbi:egghead [Carabus blaptoides fortunei]
MRQIIKRAAGVVGYAIQCGCIAYCTFEYIGDFVVCTGPSMEPTIFTNNIIFTEHLTPRFRKIERGDIIIAKCPANPKQYICKRVVGLPGDQMKIDITDTEIVPRGHVWLEADSDWIVHLDEETLLTENSVRGVLNFVLDGKHQFGQGLITYANEDVVNWVTTLADSFRVADDMGKLRLQFSMFHKPLFSWKGSFVVTQTGAEKAVSFDNGLDGSVAEDCYFAMRAYQHGYSFNFVEGEMWEKSPFSLWDFVQQRKRWLQGILLVVHSKSIPLRNKILLAISCYSWVTLPLSTSNVILAGLCPIPCPAVIDFICAFIGAVNIYMYIFGVVKSFSLYRFGMLRFALCICGALSTIPFNIIIENVAVIWGLFGKKHKFYVVNKNIRPAVTV